MIQNEKKKIQVYMQVKLHWWCDEGDWDFEYAQNGKTYLMPKEMYERNLAARAELIASKDAIRKFKNVEDSK